MKLKGKVKELKIYSAKEIRGQIQKHELIELRRYDYNGHLIERCYNRESWTGDDESKVIGCKTINKYDENDRIIYSCDYEDGEIILETTYKYTSNGMLAEIYSKGDYCTDNDKTTYKYTSKGMLAEICSMFDRLTFMYDSMGNKTKRNQFDDSGKLISSKEWKYDENGSLIEIIRRKENHITYRKIYDKHGHLVGYGSYNGEIKITYEYNEKGYLILAKEKNERTKYVYNGNGQLVARYIIYGSNEDCEKKILYKYDDYGNLIEKRSFECVLDYAFGSFSACGKILEFLIAEETWLYDNIGNLKEFYRNIEDDSNFHLYHIDSMDGAYDEIDLFDDEINDDESDELNDDERDARNDDENDYSIDEELTEVIKKIKNYDMKGNIIEDFHFEGNNQLFSVGRFYEYTYHEDSLFLFFDTETTGLPKDYNAPISDLDNWPRLVQLSWKLSDENGKQISYGNYIVKPSGFVISEKATEIHGITTDFAKKNGVALCEALRLFSDDLKKATIIVGHNVSFDKKVIGAEMLRTGSEDIVNQKKSICTMKSSIDFCAIKSPYGYKYPSLQELYFKLFGTTFSDAHDSSVDIAATEKCFWELKRRKVVKI